MDGPCPRPFAPTLLTTTLAFIRRSSYSQLLVAHWLDGCDMDIPLSSDALDLSFHPDDEANLLAVGLISGKIQLVDYSPYLAEPSSSRTPASPPQRRHVPQRMTMPKCRASSIEKYGCHGRRRSRAAAWRLPRTVRASTAYPKTRGCTPRTRRREKWCRAGRMHTMRRRVECCLSTTPWWLPAMTMVWFGCGIRVNPVVRVRNRFDRGIIT